MKTLISFYKRWFIPIIHIKNWIIISQKMPWILIYYIRNMKFNSSEPIQIHSIKIIGMWPNFVKTTKAKFYKNIKKKKGPIFFWTCGLLWLEENLFFQWFCKMGTLEMVKKILDMWLAMIGRESLFQWFCKMGAL